MLQKSLLLLRALFSEHMAVRQDMCVPILQLVLSQTTLGFESHMGELGSSCPSTTTVHLRVLHF